MFKQCLIFLLILICSGCASVSPKNAASVGIKPADLQKSKAQLLSTKPPVKPRVPGGVIFGKADFRGVLQVGYVKLRIVDQNSPHKMYELFFGKNEDVEVLPWQSSLVQPKYFFLELPAGSYRIISISIPVGTTLATERTDIAFTVEKATVIYLGTLRVTGTDQKIKFGVLPLLRPGFNYKVDILNEKEDAIQEFKKKYPWVALDIQIKLMKEMHIQAY